MPPSTGSPMRGPRCRSRARKAWRTWRASFAAVRQRSPHRGRPRRRRKPSRGTRKAGRRSRPFPPTRRRPRFATTRARPPTSCTPRNIGTATSCTGSWCAFARRTAARRRCPTRTACPRATARASGTGRPGTSRGRCTSPATRCRPDAPWSWSKARRRATRCSCCSRRARRACIASRAGQVAARRGSAPTGRRWPAAPSCSGRTATPSANR
jgi:hypothetical protein